MREEETTPWGRWMPYGMGTAVTIRCELCHQMKVGPVRSLKG